jgi:tetraprenyl-beta-curcumene synthase
MPTQSERRRGLLAQGGAFLMLVGRYATTMHRHIERELQHWRTRAHAIDDPERRAHALTTLHDAAVHARLNATTAALAPRAHRARVVVASVALEIMYDYLDAVTEGEDSLETALGLYESLRFPFTDEACDGIVDDYVRELALTCRTAFRTLPSHTATTPLARSVATTTAAAQARCHVCCSEEFEDWASHLPRPDDLEWWEAAAGWSAGVMTLHTLLALSATRDLTAGAGLSVIAAYERVCAAATLHDSLVDQGHDKRTHGHSYVGYYASDAAASVRIAAVTRRAMTAVAALPRSSYHAMAVTGIVGYYLTAPEAAAASISTDPTRRELGLMLRLMMMVFRLLRRLRRSLFPPLNAASGS